MKSFAKRVVHFQVECGMDRFALTRLALRISISGKIAWLRPGTISGLAFLHSFQASTPCLRSFTCSLLALGRAFLKEQTCDELQEC